MTSYEIGPLWETAIEKPCSLCGTATSTNIMSSHPMCAACHRRAEAVCADLHAKQLVAMEARSVEECDHIRDLRRVDVARLGLQPPWWRPIARWLWMRDRLAVNAHWKQVVIEILPKETRDSAAFRAFAVELHGMEQLVSDLPRAQLHVGARG